MTAPDNHLRTEVIYSEMLITKKISFRQILMKIIPGKYVVPSNALESFADLSNWVISSLVKVGFKTY